MCKSHRREFLAQGALALGAGGILNVATASRAAAADKTVYVCPPCGCAMDGKLFDNPGKCPACNLELVSQEASHAANTARAADAHVSIQNSGITLSGNIVFPDSVSPKAGLVLVHGSGKTERMLPVARLLVADGFAVLTYDKRGIGMSGGTYEEMENVSEKNLELLANDAAAAMATLAENPRLAGKSLGFIGFSQAGSVIPIAAATSPAASFMGLWSGPVCTVSEQLHFQELTGGAPDFWRTHTPQGVATAMTSVNHRPDDVDPGTSLSKLSIPGLWLFGGQDNLIPVSLSVSKLESLIRRGHRNFQYKIFPDYGHNLFDTAMAPSHAAMVAWIESTLKI